MKTTKEQADEKLHDDLVNNLQELLEKNYDAQKGYKKALEDAEDGQLKTFLMHQAAKRGQFVNELDKEIRSLNETPRTEGSTTGALHRTWIDIKTAVTGNDDEAVLEEVIRGEKASVDEYEDKLKNYSFPPNVNSVINNQLSSINSTLNKVKTLEDLADSWD